MNGAGDQRMHGRPPFDVDQAKAMVGKVVLIMMTYRDHLAELIEYKQMHGRIVNVDAKRGFEVRLAGSRHGETIMLPPDMRSFHKLQPGEYRESITGETVLNPDFMISWVVTKPPPGEPVAKPDSTGL